VFCADHSRGSGHLLDWDALAQTYTVARHELERPRPIVEADEELLAEAWETWFLAQARTAASVDSGNDVNGARAAVAVVRAALLHHDKGRVLSERLMRPAQRIRLWTDCVCASDRTFHRLAAACSIQRRARRAIADPNTVMCRRRLKREFEGLLAAARENAVNRS
jgi:hypothetical protein